jgi:hypothetical protein
MQDVISFMFLTKIMYFLSRHASHMFHPSCDSWFHKQSCVYKKLFIIQCSPSSCCFNSFRQKVFSCDPSSQIPTIGVLSWGQKTKFDTILYILGFKACQNKVTRDLIALNCFKTWFIWKTFRELACTHKGKARNVVVGWGSMQQAGR